MTRWFQHHTTVRCYQPLMPAGPPGSAKVKEVGRSISARTRLSSFSPHGRAPIFGLLLNTVDAVTLLLSDGQQLAPRHHHHAVDAHLRGGREDRRIRTSSSSLSGSHRRGLYHGLTDSPFVVQASFHSHPRRHVRFKESTEYVTHRFASRHGHRSIVERAELPELMLMRGSSSCRRWPRPWQRARRRRCRCSCKAEACRRPLGLQRTG